MRFNGDQCSVCHQQPAIGGSGGFPGSQSARPAVKFRKPENPMFDLIPHRKGGQNYVPSFITQYGPIREVRFQKNPDGTADGGVHALFTVVGRTDIGSPGCTAAALPPTDFESEYKKGNLSFRIPLQTFGLGLIEAIQDSTILSSAAATASLRVPLGIGGIPNRSGNDGTIARFGWKAQNKSLAIFAGEAYNVEMGVTNDCFRIAGTKLRPAIRESTNPMTSRGRTPTTCEINTSRIRCTWSRTGWNLRFSCGNWLRRNPFRSRQRDREAATVRHRCRSNPGIGCFLCHTPTMMTGPRHETGGARKSTGASVLGPADPSYGQRTWRTTSRRDWRKATCSARRPCGGWDSECSSFTTAEPTTCSRPLPPTHPQVMAKPAATAGYRPSEATAVVHKFNALSREPQQAILDFLRSL